MSVSFVGSTTVARYVYSRATANGKRAQCQGGAKNPLIVLPDADIEEAVKVAAESAFGCAGQRCLAVSVAVTVGEAQRTFRDSIAEAASKLKVGNGLEDGVQMGPVITPQSKERVESLIGLGEKQGAKVLLDGRHASVPKHERGNFVKPTILDDVPATSDLTDTEIFGPVLSLVHADSIDEALSFRNSDKNRQGIESVRHTVAQTEIEKRVFAQFSCLPQSLSSTLETIGTDIPFPMVRTHTPLQRAAHDRHQLPHR